MIAGGCDRLYRPTVAWKGDLNLQDGPDVTEGSAGQIHQVMEGGGEACPEFGQERNEATRGRLPS
jgi:hypothetical protein